MAKRMFTKFFVRDVRSEGESAERRAVSKKVYRVTNRKNSEEGLPMRVETMYEGGHPVKLTTLLPKPAGWTR